MRAPDLVPSRLAQARAKLATLLRERQGGEIGLVAWADDAYTVAPLTADAGNIALFLDALAPEVMPVDGHRPERAITHAATLLHQAGFERGDILLVTMILDDPVWLEEPLIQTTNYVLNNHTALTYYPCTVSEENVSTAVPHFLPGTTEHLADAAGWIPPHRGDERGARP